MDAEEQEQLRLAELQPALDRIGPERTARRAALLSAKSAEVYWESNDVSLSSDLVDEAIEIVNSSRFGNGTSIFTESAAAVRRYRHDVEAGMIGVNIGVAAPVAFFPFSGWKDSFLGDLHAHGGDAVEFFTRKKTVTSRYYSDGQGHGAYFVEK